MQLKKQERKNKMTVKLIEELKEIDKKYLDHKSLSIIMLVLISITLVI
jgi:hypothetical protein